MMISPSSRVLFVHVQKTGGSTIDAVLEAALPDAQRPEGTRARHIRLQGILRRHPELADYWTFGFVRNPWARLHSWHTMIRRWADEPDPTDETRFAGNALWDKVLADYPDFEQFVLQGTRDLRWLRWPQISYLRTKTRSADFIGRQERFDEDMRFVLDHLGVEWPGEIPRHNAAGEARDYRGAYSPRMRDRVAEVFAEDIATFDYEF